MSTFPSDMSNNLQLAVRDHEGVPLPGMHPAPAIIPLAGRLVSMVLSLVTLSILAVCITRRTQMIREWRRVPLTGWLIIVIYLDSFAFVFVTALFKDIGINESTSICDAAILMCLACYMSTKIFIYYFMVEKAYIVRGSRLPRMKDKLYLVNCLGMLLPYIVVVVLNFIYRFAYIDQSGMCIIGMQKVSMIPLISFDVVVNVYLTCLFLMPLRRLYSYKNNSDHPLRTVALRTFIGSLGTLTSSVINLMVLMLLHGEPGWICLICCNADILFSVLVLHWVTSTDSARTGSSREYGPGASGAPVSHRNPRASKDLDNIKAANFASAIRSRNEDTDQKIWQTKMGPLGIQSHCVAVEPRGEEIQLQGIHVRTEHVRRVENFEGDGRSERSEVSYIKELGDRVPEERDGSTDGIVEK